MPILGNIIKSALEITDKVVTEPSPKKDQKEVLEQLLKKARHTAFGREYNFESILKKKNFPKAFSNKVPYHDYNSMHSCWWKRQMEGEADVTWPGLPRYYALSAGTTGSDSKRIPVTEDMLDAIRKTSMLQILSISNFDMPPDFFEKEIMMLGSTTKLDNKGLYEEGEISGISAKNIPGWFERFYRPGKEIAAITDWDTKIEAIAKKAKKWDIGAMAGIPSWNELMLKKIIEYHKVKNIHEIWPNLQFFSSGGVAFGPYRKPFELLLDKPITVIDTYLASEGFIAFQSRPNDELAMTLSTNSGIFFEFVPFKEENINDSGGITEGAESLRIDEVEEGKDYILVVSTVGGAWRYMIGDTIRFTDKEKAEIIITGRTKHFLNVVGSQLSVIQMNTAFKEISEKYNLQIPEFTVAAIRENGEYLHHWYLGIEKYTNMENIAKALDDSLKNINKAYKMARSKALKAVKVTMVSPDVFYSWNEKKQKKGGQVKMPRVMKEDEFNNWKDFTKNFDSTTSICNGK